MNWSWVISNKPKSGERDKQQMDYEFMHAAFPSRMDAGRSLTGKGKGKQKPEVSASQSIVTGAPQPCKIPCVVSRVLHHRILRSCCSSGTVAHERLNQTLRHHAGHHPELEKRFQVSCWNSWPQKSAEEGPQRSARLLVFWFCI